MAEILVETFEEIETTGDGDKFQEFDEQFKPLVEELELDGQKKLYQSDDESVEAKPTPYSEMDSVLWSAIKKCFTCQSINNYSAGPIPIRVLQVYQYARSLNYYDAFLIYHSKGSTAPDPFLIARKGDDWSGTWHMLARWGTELTPFKEIIERCAEIWREKVRVSYRESIDKLTRDIALINGCGHTTLFNLNEHHYSSRF